MKNKNDIKHIHGVRDITPSSFHCGIAACPAIFETDRETYVLIGTLIDTNTAEKLIPGRVGEGEVAIEVPKSLLPDVKKNDNS